MDVPSGQLQSLAARGKGLTTELDQLEAKLSVYSIAKLLVDDDTFDLIDSFEEEGRRTRLSYHAFYESTHKRWVEWANDAETAMVDIRGYRSELTRFRKLRDQVNRFYSKREIDLPSIGVRVKEQVAIVERIGRVAGTNVLPIPPKRQKILPEARSTGSRLQRLVDRVEKNPYYKLVIIVSVTVGFLFLILQLLSLL